MLSQSDANLLPHDVHSGCRFGHRMFDLNAGVHLDEIECLILVKKLDRSSPPVADPTTRRRASPTECLDLNTRYARRRRLLENLLVAPLHGAVPFPEPQSVAVTVT